MKGTKKTNKRTDSKNNHYVEQASPMNTVHLDDNQIRALIDTLNQSISETSHRTIEGLSKSLNKEKIQRNDFFSLFVKGALSSLFVFLGVFLFVCAITEWNTLWVGGLQKLGVIIVLIYCVIFVVLGVDIWREKDRNYLISIFLPSWPLLL